MLSNNNAGKKYMSDVRDPNTWYFSGESDQREWVFVLTVFDNKLQRRWDESQPQEQNLNSSDDLYL